MPGIYIHVPFCYQRCHYCDFYSTLRLEDRNSFVKAVTRELICRKDFLKAENIDTIYFGGGTPSVLNPDEIGLIIESIKASYNMDKKLEITLEANPDDLDKNYIDGLLAKEVNRLSIGIQSFNDNDLVALNRRHDARQAINAVNDAYNKGFKNMSIDLIYGLPGQSCEGWKKNIEMAVSLPIDHISAYHLTYEKGTKFFKWLKKGKLQEASDDLSLEMFENAVELFERNGFEHYEISNFARNKRYSRHNTKYWYGEKYLGVGPSAHSFNGQIRLWNVSNIDKWMMHESEEERVVKSEEIDRKTRRNEMIMTRLRTKWGIPGKEFIKQFGEQSWEQLIKMSQHFIDNNLMELKEDDLQITRKGKFLSDGIIAELFVL